MSWEYEPDFDAAFRAALKGERNLVYVCPPAWWAIVPLFAELPAVSTPGVHNVVLVPEAVGLSEGATHLGSLEHVQPAHAATGLTRTGRLLRQNQISTLVSTPPDLLSLLSRSGLDLGLVRRIVICWPELHADPRKLEMLDTILGECRDTQRVVVTSDSSANADFLERHARRAPTATFAAPAEVPRGAARYAVTDFLRAPAALNAALDVLDPGTTLVWDPVPDRARLGIHMVRQSGVTYSAEPPTAPLDFAVAIELPTPDVFNALEASARNVLLLVRAFQIPFVRAMVANARPLRLPSEADRATDRAARLRKQIRDHIEQNTLTDGLLALTTLFDEHDPATVAAALFSRLSLPEETEYEEANVPAWVRIRVEAGKRHKLRTGDLVGALLNAVAVPKNRIGRVDVRDSYSLVEVRAEAADKALKGLNGLVLRGNKLAARLDRR